MKHQTGTTQQQIADRMGISRMSVMRAFQGHPKVSAEKRRLILETAREMGYHADSNQDARALIARRYGQRLQRRVLGYAGFGGPRGKLLPYAAQIMEGVGEVARRNDVELLLLHRLPTGGWEKVDGVLVHSAWPAEIEKYRELEVNVVSLMSSAPGISSVTTDDFSGARAATEYLVSLGHRRIAYLLDLHVSSEREVQRKQGYLAALGAAGITPDPRWIGNLRIDAAEFLQRGRDSMREWMARDWNSLGCTALLVQNDRAAMGAMDVLQQAGVRIPEQLSVVGCDSTEECEIVRPHLTSMKMPLYEVGALGAEMLLRQINNEAAEAEHKVLPVGLDVRASTAPPPQM